MINEKGGMMQLFFWKKKPGFKKGILKKLFNPTIKIHLFVHKELWDSDYVDEFPNEIKESIFYSEFLGRENRCQN